MTKKESIKIFEEKKVRAVWDDEHKKLYFYIVDVVGILTDSVDGHKYCNKLKERFEKEGIQAVTNCHQLKLVASDGKKRFTGVADTEHLLSLKPTVELVYGISITKNIRNHV